MRDDDPTRPTHDVIVVGYGPTGATLAGLLAMRGIRTLVLERDDAVYRLPRAGTCDDEALRIWQALGIIDRLQPILLPQDCVEFADAGRRPIVELRRSGGFGYGYPALAMHWQPFVEEVIRERVERLPALEVRLGHEVESFEDAEGVVTVTARERRTGALVTARGRYLVACDGGRSTIRERLGITFTGTTYQRWLVLDAEVADPARLPRHLVYVCDPRRPAVTYPQAFSHHRWQFMLRRDETREQMETDATAEELLAPWSGLTQIALIRKAVYVYHARVAGRWKVGRVLLAGDAAHVMPPFGGQGMNSGLRDAAGLAWRLALVVRGRAAPALLESYEVERVPHVRRMITMSRVLAAVLQTRWRALAAARNVALRGVVRLPVVGAFLRRGQFKPAPSTPAGFIAGGSRHGRRDAAGVVLVQPHVRNGTGQRVLLDEMLGTDWAVLALDADPRAVVDAETAPMWEGLPTRFVRVVPAGASRADVHGAEVVADEEGALAAWFGAHGATLVVVRPDRVVFGGCDVRPAAAVALARTLRAALDAPEERHSAATRRLSTALRDAPQLRAE